MRQRRKTGFIGHLGNRKVFRDKQRSGIAQPGCFEVIARILVGELLEFTLQLRAAYPDLPAEGLDRKIGVGDLLFDNLVDFLEHLFIDRFYLDVLFPQLVFTLVFFLNRAPQLD